VQNTAIRPKITVSADGSGIVSQGGALLLTETARHPERRRRNHIRQLEALGYTVILERAA
jgi:hypothetical protein